MQGYTDNGPAGGEILLPVTWGDFLDRLTIQELRAARLPDNGSREQAARQLARMQAILEERGPIPGTALAALEELRLVNAALWDAESAVREARRAVSELGREEDASRFCELAQRILAGNEHRAALKKDIDQAMGHPVEHKFY